MATHTDAADTSDITEWRSILTLVVFILTNSIIVLFPFHIPVYIHRRVYNAVIAGLVALRVIAPASRASESETPKDRHVRLEFPMGLTTAPLIGVLLLLATTAIGKQEVKNGTIGANNIVPLDIVAFTLTMGYIISSIDASGLVRWLTFRVVRRYGRNGRKLFMYLYIIFAAVGCFFGNDAVIQMGAMFLAYMTRVSTNIIHPRAWIHTHFAIANVASAIFVSSSTTNVAIVQAFRVGFAEYTANIVVPVIIAVLLLPLFLLYFVFVDEALVPSAIAIHELPEEMRNMKPVNADIPNGRGVQDPSMAEQDISEKGLDLEEICNPYLDKAGALVGIVLMAATLVVLLALAALGMNSVPVFWVTLPAASIKLAWDVATGWLHRHETRKIAREGAKEIEEERQRRIRQSKHGIPTSPPAEDTKMTEFDFCRHARQQDPKSWEDMHRAEDGQTGSSSSRQAYREREEKSTLVVGEVEGLKFAMRTSDSPRSYSVEGRSIEADHDTSPTPGGQFQRTQTSPDQTNMKGQTDVSHTEEIAKPTLVSTVADVKLWAQETFPSATILVQRLPFSILPFAIPTFILVQALVSTGWIAVFARGWDNWTQKSGTVGAVGGMAFLSVSLSNFTGTNIGATVLLARVLQDWEGLHVESGVPITKRSYWGAVYALAIGANYAAFSLTFGASLAGIGWRRDLRDKHIQVQRLEFARVNFPLIAFTMIVSCTVLVGEVYLIRGEDAYAAR
ncbi:putative arsenite efflux transporter ArsB-like protein [Xylariaceae sp. FL0016]|nr:putative arsenite efflux transporter ArsB-like protein [Xylariaceae sp. FL0016]